jgi:hypothetical protein
MSQVAPVAIGIAKPIGATTEAIRISMAVDPHSRDLTKPPTTHGSYNPHYHIKAHTQKQLEQATAGIKKGPKAHLPFEITVYPGFLFPHTAGGTLLLDSVQTDPACTTKKVREIGEQISDQYQLKTIYAGTDRITGGQNLPPICFSVPTVARMALEKQVTAKGRRQSLSDRFARAAADLMHLGG